MIHSITGVCGSAFCSIMYILFFLAGPVTNYIDPNHKDNLFEQSKLSQIDLKNSHHALELCKRYPELENYRIQVIKTRKLLNGEYLMMVDFDEKEKKRKKEAILKDDFEKLHGKITWKPFETGRVEWEPL